MTKHKYIIILSCVMIAIFIVPLVLFGGDVLLENTNVTNHMDPSHWVFDSTFRYIVDTMETHGIGVHYTAEEGWRNLMNMDLLLYIHPWGTPFPDSIMSKMAEFVRNGGNMVLLTQSDTFPITSNEILTHEDFPTTMRVTDLCESNRVDYIFNFPPLTNGYEPYSEYTPAIIACGNNAYPFMATDTLYEQNRAAIAYPFLEEGNCDSYVILVTGTHGWKYYFTRIVPYRICLHSNIVLTALDIPGYSLPPCAVPEPFEIEVDSVPECANPGDTITLTGRNLWQGSNENIGGDIEIYFYGPRDTVVIPFEYSDHRPDPHSLYNTWLKFVCPDLPEGEYDVELGHKAITFYAGKITIPCESPFYLCHRAPNPFTPNGDGINDEAEFEFPGLGYVPGTIKIFTLGNLRVRTIEVPIGSGAKEAAKWDGRDDSGAPMRPGIYIYTIRAEGRIKCDGTVTLAR